MKFRKKISQISFKTYVILFSFYIDLHSPIIFEVLWLMCFIDVWGTIIGSASFDGLMCAFAINILTHLKILQKRFDNLDSTRDGNIKDLLEYHAKIQNCFEVFRSLNRIVFVNQLGFVFIVVCFNGFAAVMVRKIPCRLSTS